MERIGTEIENRLYRPVDAEGGHTKSATYGIPCLLFFFSYTRVSCLRTSLGVFMHLRDLLLHAAMNMQGIGVPFGECENNGGQKTTRVLYRGRDGLIVKRSLYVCIYVCPCLRRRKNANLAIVILPISRGAQHSCSFLTVKPWILGPPHSFLGRNGVCTSAFLLV